MSEPAVIRVAAFNIRSIRALDRNSWWWWRRRRLGAAVTAVGADLWGLQEVYRAQNRWLSSNVFGSNWECHGLGRNRRGGGEMCPIWVRKSELDLVSATVRWYGDTADKPGTRIPGARFPRIATLAQIRCGTDREMFVVANTHLDERSQTRRLNALEQLADWLRAGHAGMPTIVLGDLNCTLGESPVEPLRALGLRPVLGPDDGPTSHDFNRNPTGQIDHIFVSQHWTVASSSIARSAGNASDHWPVVADLSR